MLHSDSTCDLSIIVPVYNVEAYLDECLQSLVDQTAENFEVVIVDDGSTDSSAEIAKRFDAAYENFHYFYKVNGGLGSARNYGIQMSKGKYITFCDSDDVIPNDAYKKMLDIALTNDSDIVNGNVERFNSKKVWPSSLHKDVFKFVSDNTTVSETPDLLFDTISCNKLFKRTFWDEMKVSFPEGVLYEDIPVVVPLLCSAKRIGMVRDVTYRWRAREGANRSITQERADFKNLADRLRALRSVDSFFASHQISDEVDALKEWKWLNLDLPIYINACPDADQDYFDYLADYAVPVFTNARKSNISKLSVIKRMEYLAICKRDRDLLLSIIDYGKNGYKFDKFIRKSSGGLNRYVLDVPKRFKDKFEPDVFDVTENLVSFPPSCVVRKAVWEGPVLNVEGFCFFPKVPCPNKNSRELSVVLCDAKTGDKVPLAVRNIKAVGVRGRNEIVFGTDDQGKKRLTLFNFHWSGFAFSVDFSSKEVSGLVSDDLYFEVTMRQDSLDNTFLLCGRTKKTKIGKTSVLSDSLIATVFFDSSGVLRVRADDSASVVLGSSLGRDGTISLQFACSGLVLTNKSGEPLPIQWEGNCAIFTPECIAQLDLGVNSILCDEKPLYFKAPFNGEIHYSGDYCWRICCLGNNRIVIERFEAAPYVVQTVSSDDVKPRLVVRGPSDLLRQFSCGYLVAANPAMEVGLAYRVNELTDVSGETSLFFDLENPCSGNNAFFGKWSVYLSTSENLLHPNTKAIGVISNHGVRIPIDICSDHKLALITRPSGQLALSSKQKWSKIESTRPRRRLVQSYLYPLFRLLPINNKKIVFEGLWGRKYYCNPRALYEYVDREHPEYKCVWSLNDERRPIAGSGIPVRRLSLRYYYHMATAKYFVNNVNFHGSFQKRDGQVYIETMHGMPLKTVGLDSTNDFRTEAEIEAFKEKCSLYDYIVVQNPEVEDIARRCYAFDGPFLETGYPRNDVLFHGDGLVDKVRDTLGLPADKKIILYAPTWRVENSFDFHFDLEKLKKTLSDHYIMLLRVHPLAAKGLDYGLIDNEFIFNATSYPSTEELFLASDVVVSDYSSLMFDYSITKKPILFYVYDLESYRDRLRGLYYDLEEIAPGPLVKTQDELCKWLADYDELAKACSNSLASFNQRFCTFERGNASERIFNQVMLRK